MEIGGDAVISRVRRVDAASNDKTNNTFASVIALLVSLFGCMAENRMVMVVNNQRAKAFGC